MFKLIVIKLIFIVISINCANCQWPNLFDRMNEIHQTMAGNLGHLMGTGDRMRTEEVRKVPIPVLVPSCSSGHCSTSGYHRTHPCPPPCEQSFADPHGQRHLEQILGSNHGRPSMLVNQPRAQCANHQNGGCQPLIINNYIPSASMPHPQYPIPTHQPPYPVVAHGVLQPLLDNPSGFIPHNLPPPVPTHAIVAHHQQQQQQQQHHLQQQNQLQQQHRLQQQEEHHYRNQLHQNLVNPKLIIDEINHRQAIQRHLSGGQLGLPVARPTNGADIFVDGRPANEFYHNYNYNN